MYAYINYKFPEKIFSEEAYEVYSGWLGFGRVSVGYL